MGHVDSGEDLGSSELMSQFFRGRNWLVGLIYALIQWPAIQIASDVDPLALLLRFGAVSLLPRDDQIADPSPILFLLKRTLYDLLF